MCGHQEGKTRHKLHIRLQQSNLPGGKGRWFACTARDSVLDIADVAETLKAQGLSPIQYNAFRDNVKRYFDQAVVLLGEGFTIDTGYFTVCPVVKGSFKSKYDTFDPKTHSVSFRFQPLAPLRRLAQSIKVAVDRGKRVHASISQFFDFDSGETGKRLTPGGIFIMKGYCIKAAGDSENRGVWFVSKNSQQRRYKVMKALLINTAGKVSGVVPALPAGRYTVEIVTHYTISGVLLKKPRTITGDCTLTVE